MAITITTEDLSQVKKILAFPSADNLLLEDDQIKEYAITPAMSDYFIKFPIKERVQSSTGGTSVVSLDFPDEFTHGVVDIRLTDVGIVTGTGTSFWDLVYFQQLSGGSLMGGGQGAYGIRGYNPNNLIQTRDTQRAAYKSYQNTYMTVRYDVDDENRKVIIYTTTAGYVNVTWAKHSDNFNAIKYNRKYDVIKLSQAYLLDHFADTFSILSDSSLDLSINVEAIKNRSQELKTEVRELWDSFPDVIALHSS